MTRYRLLDGIDWDTLNNERITLQISPQYVIAAKRDGSIVVLAKAVQSRVRPAKEPAWQDLEQTNA